jgi:2-succinyl-6-hydroxy-2,4-cyclohexadiene-1-carboxylate synthase
VAGLSYILSGDRHRPAILFVHGFMGSGADWADITSALDEHFCCIAPDLPGHGRSVGLTPQVYTLEGASKMLRDLLDGLEISRATLAGYSMGGRLALYLALRYPGKCSGLFLESTSPGIEDAAERKARRHADEEEAKSLESGDFEEFLEDWYQQPLFASLARHEGLAQEIIEVRLRNDPRELARSLRGFGTGMQPSLWGDLPGLTVPALAIAGEFDEKFVRVSRRMAAWSPNVRAAVVRGAGHSVHIEAPGAYLALLKRFLGT